MNAEKILTLLLRFNGVLLSLALPTIFLPVDTMESVHKLVGLGDFPGKPITEYLARSCSLLYGVHGLVTLWIAIRPRRYWSAIGPLALLHVFIGCIMIYIDITSGMPWYWTMVEGPPIIAFGSVLYVMWFKAGKAEDAVTE